MYHVDREGIQTFRYAKQMTTQQERPNVPDQPQVVIVSDSIECIFFSSHLRCMAHQIDKAQIRKWSISDRFGSHARSKNAHQTLLPCRRPSAIAHP